MNKQMFIVRSGKGSVNTAYRKGEHELMHEFTDSVGIAERAPRQHSAWQSVKYNGQRYQLFGGIHVFWFICLNHPLKPN